ncbi:MAG TPA: DUF2997 domain-containing protein [Pirellulaceae bacterium]|nr:DUF2997 domain-containing protein [Pirellulaceae bacterium]
MSKIIEVIVSPQGNASVTTKGFAGNECRNASRDLEAALGSSTSETLTAEFHSAEFRQQTRLEQET